MKLSQSEIRRMANFTDEGLLRYIKGAKPKINLDEVIEKVKPLAASARMSNQVLVAEKFDDLIESVTKIKSELSLE